MFREFIPLSEDETTQIWQEAIIVLDTTVLLHVYEFAEKTREEFLNILLDAKVKDRLWLPFQVAEEFHRNRLNVIRGQEKPHKDIVGIVDSSFGYMEKNLRNTNINKHHPYVNKKKALDEVARHKREMLEWLENERLLNKKDIAVQDPLLEKIYTLYEKKISQDLDQAELESLFKEGKERYANKIPPGYEDDNKNERLRYGDLIIWKSLICEAKEKDKDVVFVTDDSKEDWWVKNEDELISPRPELIKEFRNGTHHEIIICTSEEFFKRGNSLIGMTTSENSITDINRAISTWASADQHNWWHTAPAIKRDLSGQLNSKSKYFHDYAPPGPSEQIAQQLEDTKNILVDWFFSTYKDPADGVPYDGREGGYQYFNGGPYYAEEEMRENFPDTPESVIDAALSVIENQGYEWVKHEEY
ncbi:MAG: DUF4935 domain-containing protein [Rhodospirillales bacterium]|nr:DUF4935 domain-containing protein [Rhodospirillales bacterium]